MTELVEIYDEVVRSRFDHVVCRRLADTFRSFQLPSHAEALSAYCENVKHLQAIDESPYPESAVVVSLNPPADHNHLDDLWFDVSEMTFCRYCYDNDCEIGEWVSVYPTMNWQYEAFLKMSRRVLVDSMFVDESTFQGRRRIFESVAHRVATQPALELYHAEAEAYALWHRKVLAGIAAEESINESLNLTYASDKGSMPLAYWDSVRPDEDPEAFRLAVLLGAGHMRLGEWETGDRIGIVTAYEPGGETEMKQADHRLEYVTLENNILSV